MVSTQVDRFKTVNLDKSMRRQIATLLQHAYHGEPNYQHLLDSKKSGYRQRLRATFREIVNIHYKKGEQVLGIVDTENDQLCGVALVLRNKNRVNLSRSVIWRLKMLLTAGFDCTVRFMDYQKLVKDAVPTDQFQIITQLCIHPRFREMGLGEQLLDAVYDDCAHKDACQGVYLDSGNPKYASFYKRMGFSLVSELDINDFQEYIYLKPGPAFETVKSEQNLSAKVLAHAD